MNNQQKNLSNNNLSSEDRVDIVFYTDPLCCWSWALLPELLKLQSNFNDFIDIHYCMGGLIKDWNSFSDPVNNVHNPSQMGPVWMDASQKLGLDIKYNLWAQNPPSSSYPACIAVKTAALQSSAAEALYFKLAANAAVSRGENISEPDVLIKVAKQVAEELPEDFNLPLFLESYNNDESRNAFRNDLQKVKTNSIGRFPTVTMSYGQKKLMFTGYRTYNILLDAFTDLAPALAKARL